MRNRRSREKPKCDQPEHHPEGQPPDARRLDILDRLEDGLEDTGDSVLKDHIATAQKNYKREGHKQYRPNHAQRGEKFVSTRLEAIRLQATLSHLHRRANRRHGER